MSYSHSHPLLLPPGKTPIRRKDYSLNIKVENLHTTLPWLGSHMCIMGEVQELIRWFPIRSFSTCESGAVSGLIYTRREMELQISTFNET